MPAREILREEYEERELREVCRLEGDRAEGEPCAGAHHRLDKEEEGGKEREGDQVQRHYERRPADKTHIDR